MVHKFYHYPSKEKLPESFESFKFVSYRAKMSGEFDSTKDSQSTKLKASYICKAKF